ncbi:pseudouridine synthase [Moraxella cuniculi]|uniref:Ribosomal large subunit pseudouridine synthase A n=1 Tax=Moraxella cuniculi TaxID=34061 RepID=A0A448GUQ4_9GAMM|nr:pseudouridine synthase [Moraxella cuniculi]VEG12487.1 Ribosomal large subunit pseudouridine synthase A [Moraxella cuniculi]
MPSSQQADGLMRQGISPSKLYLPKLAQTVPTIFAYLCQKFPHITPDEWRGRFEQGLVLHEGKVLTQDSPYQHGLTISYYRQLACETIVPFAHRIICENDELLVVDKPHFLTVAPAGRYVQQTLLTRLKAQTGNANISPVHRLDRETAGVILFAKTPKARTTYQKLFANHAIDKCYHAIAPASEQHHFPLSLALPLERGEPFYTMKVGQGEPNTHTLIEPLQISRDGKWCKYQLRPTTGKLHQLRVHMNYLGLAICHDSFYPVVRHRADDDFSKPLQLLAKRLSFVDPITGEMMRFESEFELDLENFSSDKSADGL